MKRKNLMTLALLGITSLVSFSAQADQETAWSRSAKDEQKQERADEKSFAARLSPLNNTRFWNMTPDQRKSAMDMADQNKMSPDEAVDKASRSAQCNN